MKQPEGLVLVGAAGAATIAAGVLTSNSSRLLYVVLVTCVLAAAAGVGSVRLVPPPPALRSALVSFAAFAAGMVVAILALALYEHLDSKPVRSRPAE